MENPLEIIKQLRDEITAMPEKIEKAAILKCRIVMLREGVDIALSRLKDLDPASAAAYTEAQKILGL